jgi:hypothetical protein
MKAIVEIKGEGLEKLLGEEVILFCANYFYAGKLAGVNKTFVKLAEPRIVYETGAWDKATWLDAQKLHVPELCVRVSMIEAWAKGKA